MDISEGTEYWLNIHSEAEARGKVMTGDWEQTTKKHLEILKKLDIKQSDVVLDYGCGIGRLLVPIREKCKQIIGADISDKILSYAIKEVDGKTLFLSLKDETGKGLPLEHFDKAYAMIVLQHIEKYKAIRTLIRINNSLKPDGTMLIQFPNLNKLRKMYTLYMENKYSFGSLEPRMEFYTRTELEYIFDLLKTNYVIEEIGTDYIVTAKKTKNIIPLDFFVGGHKWKKFKKI